MSKVVTKTAKKGQELRKKAVEQGKVVAKKASVKAKSAAKVVKKKTAEAKVKLEIEKLKYSIGNEMVKKGLPAPKGDSKIASMLSQVKKLEKEANKQGKSTKK